MLRQLFAALAMTAVATVVLGLAYPLAVTGIAQVLAPERADGSLVERDGEVVGSALLAQGFTGPEYFHPRPSAVDHDPRDSGGSNLGPSAPALAADVAARAAAYRGANGLAPDAPVPVDAVTASASGLDPHISPENARLQADRVARARGLDAAAVRDLVGEHTVPRALGVLGEPGVNVLGLNLALDRAAD